MSLPPALLTGERPRAVPRGRRRCWAIAGLLLAASVAAQDKPPASPFPFPLPSLPAGLPFIPMGPQPPEVPVNSPAWQSIVAEYGAPLTGRQAKMVEDAVAELSRGAGALAPRGGYRSTLLDTSVLNAFAIGDGNVFVTRQLLAYMNDESELIGVMGHEVGHVIGGHSRFKGAAHAGQERTDQLFGVFLPPLRDVVQLGSTMVIQGFGRSQEHAADVAGVKFLADQGRDPLGMGRALAILDADSKLQQKMFGGRPPAAFDYWLSSHPLHAERISMVQAAANMAPRGKPSAQRSPQEFVRSLDGMLFDDSPEQGIIDGTHFSHPVMKFALDAAPGFRLLNAPTALLMKVPAGGSATLKSLAGSGSAVERFKAAWDKSFPPEIAAPVAEPLQIGGMEAASGAVERKVGEVPVRLAMWLVVWSDSQSFLYVAVDPKGASASQHAATARSLRRLRGAEAAAVKVRRLRVVDIATGDSVASLAEGMAYADFREERFRLINGLFSGQPLPKSGPIKLVVWSPQNAGTSP